MLDQIIHNPFGQDYLFKPKNNPTNLCHSICPFSINDVDWSRFLYPYSELRCQFFKDHHKILTPFCGIYLRDPNNKTTITFQAEWIYPDYRK